MLSILIPIYNFDITTLVTDLYNQSKECGISFEIILIDDASDIKYKEINRKIQHLSPLIYIELKSNVGRSKIRNQLAKLTRYPNLLFLDCDSSIPQNFIKNYLPYLNNTSVCCGGRIYQKQKPENQFLLHWKYGKFTESQPARVRNQYPNKSFMTNNFLISSDLLLSIGFNETIVGYGHEDTLFGYELKKRNIKIKHIQNPLIHECLEKSGDFLHKTKEAIKNLVYILTLESLDSNFKIDIKLYSTYKILKKIGIIAITSRFYLLIEKKIISNLLGKNPSLYFFALYKLIHFHIEYKKNERS